MDQGDCDEGAVMTRLTNVCAQATFAPDLNFCKKYQSTLKKHMSKKMDSWNCEKFSPTIFCDGFQKIAAQHKNKSHKNFFHVMQRRLLK